MRPSETALFERIVSLRAALLQELLRLRLDIINVNHPKDIDKQKWTSHAEIIEAVLKMDDERDIQWHKGARNDRT